MASVKKATPITEATTKKNVTKTKSKSQLVLQHLKTHKRGITSMDAFEKYKATRLSSIIFNLRSRGYDIVTIEERTETGTRYARYILKEGA